MPLLGKTELPRAINDALANRSPRTLEHLRDHLMRIHVEVGIADLGLHGRAQLLLTGVERLDHLREFVVSL